MAIRQRRTVRSGQERCYLRCHSCSSYLGLIFLISYHLAFVSFFSIQPLPITQVCTISKETKRKFNPVTKCEKVREVPCQALETGTETFKRNETNKIYCLFPIPQELCGPSGCGFVQGPEICHDEVWSISLCHFTATLTFPTFF